jgi:ubiquinone/menaquinone biosynthesis C-methylase UbiE
VSNSAAGSLKKPAVPKSNLEWQAWGEKDPLFGVIPVGGRDRGGSQPWTDEDFYETGRADWSELRQRWEKYGLEKESCLEIGCGAGRLTRHIGQDFKTAYGVDVAEGMIAYARNHVGENVQLFVTDGVTLPVPDQSLTAVFSIIVFLHFDRVEHAAANFQEMARALRPGGTIMIQLPLHAWPPNMKGFVRKGFAAAYEAYMSLRRLKGAYHRFWLSREKWSAFMQSISYDVAWLNQTLRDLGFTDVETGFFPLKRGEVSYSWVFARKG